MRTDNRTEESLEVPILDGGIDARRGQLLPGIWFHDPGFGSTSVRRRRSPSSTARLASCAYRGYPIEQLAGVLELPRVATC